MFVRIFIYATLGFALSVANITVLDPLFWCIVSLFFINDYIVRTEVYNALDEAIDEIKKRWGVQHDD